MPIKEPRVTMPDLLQDDGFTIARQTMVSNQLRTVAVDDPRVIAAIGRVPREAFVPAARRDTAYADVMVPLEDGRALNSPMATARLINAAAILPGDAILIIGAATGYAAAIALLLGRAVTAVESDAALAATAQANVPQASVVTGPLAAGAAANGPYDVIMIDGAIADVPAALRAQLAPGGRLVTGVIDTGVTRLAVGRADDNGRGFALAAFADVDVIILPGFARPHVFTF
jgi:protein-L-isoaspartate(D-aspartate) O-methyltransferase